MTDTSGNPFGLFPSFKDGLEGQIEALLKPLFNSCHDRQGKTRFYKRRFDQALRSIQTCGWVATGSISRAIAEDGWNLIGNYYKNIAQMGEKLLEALTYGVLLQAAEDPRKLSDAKRREFSRKFKFKLGKGWLAPYPAHMFQRFYATEAHCPETGKPLPTNKWRLDRSSLMQVDHLEYRLAAMPQSQVPCERCSTDTDIATHAPGAGWIQYSHPEFVKYEMWLDDYVNMQARLNEANLERLRLRSNADKTAQDQKIETLEENLSRRKDRIKETQTALSQHQILFIGTRVKGPDSLADKVADIITGVEYPRKDGEYLPDNVKDIYGARIVVSDESARDAVLAHIYAFSESEQKHRRIDPHYEPQFELLEEKFKDHWNEPKCDSEGNPTFAAVRCLVKYCGYHIELQIMTLGQYETGRRSRIFFKEEVVDNRRKMEDSGVPWTYIRDKLAEHLRD